ncbi:hypothetical protein L7F22_069355 [Adiantum nelumboides]|nr:hypothetical protein [Adiantum nelumboides]MCO5615067.1 hypothetical protein [Adiantum nelumboides]
MAKQSLSAVQFAVVVLAMAMVLAAWAPSMGSCSQFITYAGPGCTNLARLYSACGCSNIAGDSKGGYRFTYQGQTAAAYNQANCAGVAQTRFISSTAGCSSFGWQSFFIQC